MVIQNEHRAQQQEPGGFDSFYRQDVGDGICFLFGVKGGESTLVSVQAASKSWTAQSFAIWLERHGYASGVDAASVTPGAAADQLAPGSIAEPVEVEPEQGGISLDLPDFMLSAIREGLELYKKGYGGAELTPRAVREARKALIDSSWPADKFKRADVYLARQAVAVGPIDVNVDDPSSRFVARLVWGDDPRKKARGVDFIQQKRTEIELSGEVEMMSDYAHDSPLFYHEAEQGSADQYLILERIPVDAWPDSVIGLFGTRDGESKSDRELVSVLAHSAEWTVDTFAGWLDRHGFTPIINPSEYLTAEQLARGVEDVENPETLEEPVEPAVPVAIPEGGIELAAGSQATTEPVHVMRAGPLYDIESGDQVFDLSADDLRKIATTTQALIDAGHTVPISLEHGIERGADRRPYGVATRVYFSEEDGGIWAEKQWTALGSDFVSSAQMANGKTALRISPRVRMSKAHHPTTGALLGEGFIDVISLTTLPRQDSMTSVVMSRDDGDLDQGVQIVTNVCENHTSKITADTDPDDGPELAIETIATCDKEQEGKMSKLSVLLARGTDEAEALFNAAGLNEVDGVEKLTEKIGEINKDLEAAGIELARFTAEADQRARVAAELAVDADLEKHDFNNDTERSFYRTALLSGVATQVELARDALASRETLNPDDLITTALTAAKERGAVAADFTFNDEIMSSARANPAIVSALLEAIPTGNIVTTDTAPGSDVAGVEIVADVSKGDAANELSRIANTARREGKANTFSEAYELARAERPDLALAVYGE
jgi:hypothetical protein